MKDNTDKAAIRCVIAGCSLAIFVIFIWGPLDTIWIGPWFYEGTSIGSLAWRKAWVFNGWLMFAPILVTFGYCITTMARAIRKDAADREARASK